MKQRYFLELREDTFRKPVGNTQGYDSYEDAIAAATKKVDDANPHLSIHIVISIGVARLGGDGEGYFTELPASIPFQK